MSALPAELAAAAKAVGLEVTKVLHRTDKTLLATGEFAEQHVAVKCLLDPDPFWAAKWHHELHVYQVFADTPPPLRVPRLLYSDNVRLMILEWLEGQRLDDERYPQRTLGSGEIDAVLGCVTAFNDWSAPVGAFKAVFDYPDRFRRYRDKGYLTTADYDALRALLSKAGHLDQLNHGDPLPSNVLLADQADATMLDWEFTGLFLPGFDLAMLYTQIGAHTPDLKARIDTHVEATGTETTFVINLAAVLTRELRIHRELPDGPLRDSRLPLIEAAWADARERLQRAVGRP